MHYKNRMSIPDEYKWDLSKIFANDEAWENSFAAVKINMDKISSYQKTLKEPKRLLECLREKDRLNMDFEKLYVYANMKSHEDIRIAKYQEMCSRIALTAADFSAKMSFIVPEIIASFNAEELKNLSNNTDFEDYSYMLSELSRRRARVLSDKEEKIIAETGAIVDTFSSTFSKFDNVDVKWDKAKDSKGKEHDLTHGIYALFMQSKDRELRKNAHYSMMNGYKNLINVLASNYIGSIQSDVVYSKLRKYNNTLEYSLDGENVPEKVYLKLIEEVDKAIPLLKKYITYRKHKLGYNQHKAYDMYVNVERNKEIKMTFDEAFKMVKGGLEPLGKEYQSLLEKAKRERWIDVFESDGKRSGGYSWGANGTPPYILLNYNGTLREAFTIAHELGHSMHSYLSDKEQPYAKAQYEIFVAEIASTVNEMLLIKYLQKDAKPTMRKYLLTYLLDMYKSTVFRQSLFAEFEYNAHTVIEKGEGLSADRLCTIYEKLNIKYYGARYITNVLKYEWARIPHFYNAFYVYKYATGLIAATAIAENIFDNKPGAVEKYLRFLSSGGSKPPHEILQEAGVDLLTDEPYNRAFGLFRTTLKELENI